MSIEQVYEMKQGCYQLKQTSCLTKLSHTWYIYYKVTFQSKS